MAVRLLHVRRVELSGRLLQHQLHTSSDVYIGRPVLRDNETAEVHD